MEDFVHVLKAHLKVELDDKFCKDKWVHVVCKQVEEAPVPLKGRRLRGLEEMTILR